MPPQLFVQIRPDQLVTPSAADYLIALVAPPLVGIAPALVAASPPAPPAGAVVDSPFAMAVEAALKTIIPKAYLASHDQEPATEVRKHAKSEALKAVDKYLGGDESGGLVMKPAMAARVPGFGNLTDTWTWFLSWRLPIFLTGIRVSPFLIGDGEVS